MRVSESMRRLSVFAVATTLAAVTAGAGDASAPASFKAGLSMSFLGSPFFVALTTLTTRAAKSAGLTLLQPTDAQSDPGKQISDIQTLVNNGAQGLLVVPRDSDAIAPALNYAAKRGVPVVALDVGIHTGKVAITVRADNLEMAKTACEAVGTALKAEGSVLELQGDLLNSSGRDRTTGFESCMREKYPRIRIIARPTRWEQARAADATQTVLTVQP